MVVVIKQWPKKEVQVMKQTGGLAVKLAFAQTNETDLRVKSDDEVNNGVCMFIAEAANQSIYPHRYMHYSQ